MKRYIIILSLVGVCFIVAVLIFRPVPRPAESECLVVRGVVTDIADGGTHDVVFRIQGRDEAFYVNRGLERGLSLESLRSTLLAREITIKYPDHWTPLDPYRKTLHISKIIHDGTVVFTELD